MTGLPTPTQLLLPSEVGILGTTSKEEKHLMRGGAKSTDLGPLGTDGLENGLGVRLRTGLGCLGLRPPGRTRSESLSQEPNEIVVCTVGRKATVAHGQKETRSGTCTAFPTTTE